jgi:hypothetical protein
MLKNHTLATLRYKLFGAAGARGQARAFLFPGYLTAMRDVAYPEFDEIAAAKLAVDGD